MFMTEYFTDDFTDVHHAILEIQHRLNKSRIDNSAT